MVSSARVAKTVPGPGKSRLWANQAAPSQAPSRTSSEAARSAIAAPDRVIAFASIPHAVEEGPRSKLGARSDQRGAADCGEQPI